MNETAVHPLQNPACYPHPVDAVELIETHISWVFLAGEFAYKIKKPVRMGFLDFSTLAARRFFCEEELRLNRRTAPDLYLQVMPIAGTEDAPIIGGIGEVFDYAVQMRRFDQALLADRIAKRGELGNTHIDALAACLARFHAGLPAIEEGSPLGSSNQVIEPALQNFAEIEKFNLNPALAKRLSPLRAWTQNESTRLAATFDDRKRKGWVRECHGDLHLGNILIRDGVPIFFDCIEFSAELRLIDVMSEVAFLAMDLMEHGLEAGAWRFLNAYVEITGDHGGLAVLNYYLCYRALVRAKIALIRAHQEDCEASTRATLEGDCNRYIDLAERFARPRRTALALMHGLAGSGKSTLGQTVLEHGGAFRVRSDVERKRLHGLAAGASTRARQDSGIYAPDSTHRTYLRLQDLARIIVSSGYSAIIDAAFLRRAPREEFYRLASELGVPVVIVACRASHQELRRRVALREARMNDASEAGVCVLDNQILTEEPLTADELKLAKVLDTETGEAKRLGGIEEIAALF
ncbi:MAG: AAA family ATPase [Burkholderiales bacterium]